MIFSEGNLWKQRLFLPFYSCYVHPNINIKIINKKQ